MAAEAIVDISCSRLKSAIGDEATKRLNYTTDLEEMLEALEAIQPVLAVLECRMSNRNSAWPAPVMQMLPPRQLKLQPDQQRKMQNSHTALPPQQLMQQQRMLAPPPPMLQQQQQRMLAPPPVPVPLQQQQQRQLKQRMPMPPQLTPEQQHYMQWQQQQRRRRQQQMQNSSPAPPQPRTPAVMQQQQQQMLDRHSAPPVMTQPWQLKFMPRRLCCLPPCIGPFPRQQPLPATATPAATAVEPSPAIDQGLSIKMVWPYKWVTEVREAAHRISYMVKELQATRTTTTAAGKMTKIILHRPAASVAKDKISEEMKEIKEELRRLVKESLVLDQGDVSALQEAVPAIVGRVEDVEKIISRLFESHTNEGPSPSILLIGGNGGIGKTTVADMVFHHPWFQSYSRVWVNVLHVPELHEIGNSIISQLSREEEMSHGTHQSGPDQYDMIQKRLGELFGNGTKVLIVLDFIWTDSERWESLKSILHVAKEGSQVFVIATVRMDFTETLGVPHQTAMRIFRVKPYCLEPLRDDMCCKIVKQAAGRCTEDRSTSKEDLEPVAPEIAKYCKGFPLAAQLLGRLLQVKDYREWHKLLDKKSWSDYDPVHLSLELSYRSMPPDLRLCFAYCTMLLVDRPIAKDDLIHQWVALNLIEPSEAFSATELAEKHITRLLDMSFLRTTKLLSSTSGKDEKGEMLLDIHLEVHAFATRALGVDYCYLNGVNNPFAPHECCRYVLLRNFDTQPLGPILHPEKIRALCCYGCSKMELDDDSFSLARCLRVLALHGSSMTKLPDSVCKLEHLGYLNLSGCSQLVTIPESFGELTNLLHLDLSNCSALARLPGSVGKLVKLVYMNLSGCFRLENLPEFLGRLANLVHINLSGCSGLEKLPQSVGKLVSLVHINLSGCSGLADLPEFLGRLINLEHINLSGCSRLEKLPMSFGKLTKLKHINLSGCSKLEKLPVSFGKLISLVHINLSGCSDLSTLPESFGDLRSLLHINLSHCYALTKLPESFANLKKMVHLDLSFWSCFEGIETALDGLTNLQHLNLSHPCPYRSDYSRLEGLRNILGQFTRLEYLNLSMFLSPILYNKSAWEQRKYTEFIRGFRRLEHLDLSHNIFLCDLPGSLQELNRLHTLDLSGCIRLKNLKEWLHQMTSLKIVLLRNCDGLESYQFVVGDNKINKYVQLEDISSRELEIRCLVKMKSLVEARRIRLVEKRKIQKLKLCWTDAKELTVDHSSVDGNDLLGELEPPHDLQSLEIHSYSSKTCCPSWWTKDICFDLKNLTEVTMKNFPECTNLPPLGLLQNLKVLVLSKMASIERIDAGELSGGNKAAFKNLSKLTIHDMVKLKKFNTRSDSDEEFIFPTISQWLVIQKCPILSFVPCPPEAERLIISKCNPEMISCQNREVNGVEDLSCTSAPVTELVIDRCKISLDEWKLLHQLPSLQKLKIVRCHDLISSEVIIAALSSLVRLGFYSCGMTKLSEHLGDLASLRDLHIEGCTKLTSLPESMKRLSSLQSMHLCRCDMLKELPEWLGSLTSLQKLYIEGCWRIKSLPKGTCELAELKDFIILENAHLKQWCNLEVNKKFLGDIQPKYEQTSPNESEEEDDEEEVSLCSDVSDRSDGSNESDDEFDDEESE